MTWRIRSVILYQRNGKKTRKVDFETRGLNVISGNSQTGKSAVIDVVNYCLMSKTCPVPKGYVRRAVSHVGLHLEGPEDEFQVIRDLPAPGKATAGRVWWKQGRDLVFPAEPPELTWTREQVKGILSKYTGISDAPMLTDRREPAGPKQDVSIRHAAALLFQPQDIIANRYVSFPGLDREEYRSGLLDALPFLLKIEVRAMLEKRARLRTLKSEIRALSFKSAEQRQLRANAYPRGLTLWTECHRKGLLAGDQPADVPALILALREARIREDQRVELSTIVPDIQRLESAEREIRAELTDVRRQLRNLQDFEKAAKLHDDVVSNQLRRLTVAELLPPVSGERSCPVCQEGHLHPLGAEAQLESVVRELSSVRTIPLKVDHQAKRRRVELEQRRRELESLHDSAAIALRSAISEIAQNPTQTEESRGLDMLLGRVHEYLNSVEQGPRPDDEKELEEKRAEAEAIEAELASYGAQRREFEEKLSQEMTERARRMEVEFKRGKAALDLDDLTINVQVDPAEDAMTPLSEVGSGANWVSYHVAAAVALHRHLARLKCPVPRVLILDQPSQAWFPKLTGRGSDTSAARPPQPDEPDDFVRVKSIYELLLAETLDPEFSQVIVLDHAWIDEPWFIDRTEEWRGGEKLVPIDWAPAEDDLGATQQP